MRYTFTNNYNLITINRCMAILLDELNSDK